MSNAAMPEEEIAAIGLRDPAIAAPNDLRAAILKRKPRRRPDWVAWLLAGSVLAAGFTAAYSLDFVRVPLSRATATIRGEPKAGLPDHAQIVGRDQTGTVNQLVPLGLSINGGSGNEIVVLDGLADGTQLSAGTSLSSSRWSLPAKDMAEAFVGPPKDFSGTMEVTAKLYSSSDDILQSKVIRLAWKPVQIDGLAPPEAVRPSLPTPTTAAPATERTDALLVTTSQARAPINGVPAVATASPPGSAEARLPSKPLTPSRENKTLQTELAKTAIRSPPADEIDALLEVGERMLREGDVAAARVALRRAAEAGNDRAAQDLGMSFDPVFLHQIGATAAPDLAQAAEWYARARKLAPQR